MDDLLLFTPTKKSHIANLEDLFIALLKNRSIGPELMTAKTGPIHLSSLVEIAFVD